MKSNIFSLLKRLWKHINLKRKKQLIYLLILTILASFAEVLSIGSIFPFIGIFTAPDKIYNNYFVKSTIINTLNIRQPKDLLLPFTLIFILISSITSILKLISLWAYTRISQSITSDISLDVYTRTLYQPYSIHIDRNSSEVIGGIVNKVNSISGSAILPFLTITSSLLLILTTMITLLYINPLITIIAFSGFSLIYFLVIKYTKLKLSRDSNLLNTNSTLVIKSLQEGLGGIRDILIDGTQNMFCLIYKNNDIPLRRAQGNISFIAASPRIIIEFFAITLIATLTLFLSYKPEGFATSIPLIGIIALAAQRLLPALQQSYSSWVNMIGGKSSLSDALDLLDQPMPELNQSITNPIYFNNYFKLENLSYQYKPNLPMVLDNISITIKKGERIGFIGKTGCGKSTLLDIIMGLLIPNIGLFEVDNISVNKNNYRSWQTQVAHVPQFIYLSDATVAENIAFGYSKEKIDHNRIIAAAKKAKISDSIEKWENKYETVIGESGVKLSGGQRQRIGLARAFYKNATVIILDEATSALDTETEIEIMEELDKLENKLTIIIVAHRLSTLKNCTRIYEINSGKIRRSGTYKEMISI